MLQTALSYCFLISSKDEVEATKRVNWKGFSLGRSEKGVYCVFEYHHGLQIFLLDESCGQIVWELRHSVDLRTFACNMHARDPNLI
jgi:hypothetical protein